MFQEYHPLSIEQKWQKYWAENKVFKVTEDITKTKYYVLEMLPYPSGRVHMGHVRNYTIGDVVARFKRSQGFNVLHPMGWDAFGLPAENAAIENKTHPSKWTFSNIEIMKAQLLPMGFSYDWDREVASCSPEYYKHEQEMFIDFYNTGLAYQKESVVNWDPVDQTVLANEQVENGRGWRSGALVERKKLKQWFLKTTDFAEELINDLDTLSGWPEKVVTMQRNWIGKSQGAMISFPIEAESEQAIEVYSTRPDTIFGASFIAIAYDHPFVSYLNDAEIKNFITDVAHSAVSESALELVEKKGIFTGKYALHPFNPEIKLPIYIANFVLMDYGTGAIFGCPAHDERDFEFATKYNLPIYPVIKPANDFAHDYSASPYMAEGTLINSEYLNGLDINRAKEGVISKLESIHKGRGKTQYRLRDWGISRQRYWGAPIPIIYCDTCGVVPVPKNQLPVQLPQDVSFEEAGNPLERHPTWKHVKCPICDAAARRETDTFDTFFESSWYFLRYCSPTSLKPFDKEAIEYWLPVDQYIGGIEHAVLHLLYARFFMKALTRVGYLNLSEPFKRLLTQGMICHQTFKDKNGKWLFPNEVEFQSGKAIKLDDGSAVKIGRSEKMSKSKKNIVDPTSMLEKYGADTMRLFSLSDSPPERDLEWTDTAVEGCSKFLIKIYKMLIENLGKFSTNDSNETLRILHKTILDVTEFYQNFHFNKAIAKIRELANYLFAMENPSLNATKILLHLLNPIAPHITEELWMKLDEKKTLIDTKWPVADPKFLVADLIILAIQLNGKMRGTVEVMNGIEQDQAFEAAMNLPNVAAQLKDKTIKKIIYVKNKIINIIC